METVGNFPDLASARVAQSVLEDAGIETEIPDEYLSGVDWQMNTALHGIRIRVAPEDADVARSLLAADTPEPSEATGDDTCPRCRSEKFGPPTWKKRIKAIAIFFFPVLLLYPVFLAFSAKNECYACGHRWTPAPAN